MAGRRRESFADARARRAAVDDPAVVLEAAARFLEARSRSVHEVRRRLTGAGYQPELVDGAITRLTELGMLDDEVFAQAWVESRDRARPRGERAIREELRTKGLDRAVVDDVLEARRMAAADHAADADDGEPSVSPDRAAADRLLARNHGRWTGSPIRGSAASGPTRCWPATGSIRRPVARPRPRSWRPTRPTMSRRLTTRPDLRLAYQRPAR